MRKILMLLWVVVCCTLVNGQVSVRVVEYVPAPGQFTNQLPAVTAADDSVSVLQKAQTLLERGSLVSLGAWGGSITLHYAAGIYNHVGEYDFRVLGNAFTNSAEPGVRYVMKDENGNGIADDTWYEIAGSAHSSTETNRSYEIVYYKPSAEKEAQTGAVSDYIAWRDSEGGSGHVSKTTFHQQSYWPAWLGRDSLCIRATRLPSNARSEEHTSEPQSHAELSYAVFCLTKQNIL